MVRIIQVKQLEERRKVLVAQSHVHRQTLEREFAELKESVLAVRRKFRFMPVMGRLLRVLGPVASSLVGRKRNRANGGGSFFSRFVSGLQTAMELLPLFEKAKAPKSPESEE